ncbi:MAG: hypothetical protein DPW09_35395 [Anaerolineae bacterium]|nr:hypothetical protein [Anaerolineae bacterium]
MLCFPFQTGFDFNVRSHGGILQLSEDVLAVGIQRQGEVVIPHGSTRLQPGDVLILVGNQASLQETRRLLDGTPNSDIKSK